ncbi:TOM1-like protein 1 isoform X2 [Hyperolius riggenbachi]
MNICDQINSTVEGPKDAAKALKKRIGKNYNQKEVSLSLSLLEFCMQNCTPTFKSLVLRKEFCKDVLVKLLNPKYNLPVHLQNRILRFIMTWSKGSYNNVDQTEVKELHLDMIKKGIQFPPMEPSADEIRASQKTSTPRPSDTVPSKSCPEVSVDHLSPEQIGKLYSELDLVRMNMKVMSAILLENYPGHEIPGDMELLQELQKVCQEMQARILKLLETVQNEEVIIELVQVNDDLNNLFLRYKRFSRTRVSQTADTVRRDETVTANTNQPSAPTSELIELSLEPLPSVQNHINGYPPATATANVLPPSVPAITPQQARISDAAVAPQPAQQSNFMYPQQELLELREAVNNPLPFAIQSQLPPLPPRYVYDNVQHPAGLFPPLQNPALLMPPFQTPPLFMPTPQLSAPFLPAARQPTPFLQAEPTLLPAIPTLSPTAAPLTKDTTKKPGDANSPAPNYYELLEFDPLAEGTETEIIYEEIDTTSWKPTKGSSC